MKDIRKTKKQLIKGKRMRAGGSVVESEEKFRALIENAFDGITIVGADGRVLYESPTLDSLLGYKPEERVGGGTFDLIHPEDLPEVEKVLSDFVKKPGEVATVTLRLRHKDGSWQWMECRGKNLLQDPAIGGIVINYRDVTEHKQSDEALRESEGKYKALVEQALEGVVIAQGLPPRLVFANSTMKALLGYTIKELLSLSLERLEGLIYPDDRKLFFGHYRNRIQGKAAPSRYEFRAVKKDGTVFWVEISSRRIEYYGELAVQATFTDITERKQAEEALQRSEEKFRALIENAFDGVTIVGADGRVLYQSPTLDRILGYKPKERVGGGVLDLIHPEDLPAVKETLNRFVKNPGEVATMSLRFKHKDGSWHWMECRGNNLLQDPAVGGMVINYRDITERKQAEEALRESGQRYRAIVENSSEVIFSLDTQGRITYISPAIERLGGYAPDEVIGTSFTSYIVSEDLPGLLASMERTLAGHREPYQFRVLCKDGTTRTVISSSNALLQNGQPAGLTGVLSDVTERQWLEDVLHFSEDKYRRLVETLNEGIWQIDKDAITTYVNPRMAELLGYEIGEIIGAHLFDFMDKQGIDIANRYLQRRELGISEQHESEFIRKDGKRILATLSASPIFDADGEYNGAIAAVQDITERKRAESELRIKDSAIASSINALTLTDLNGIITYVNNSFLELWGYDDATEVLGRHITEMWKREKQAASILEAALSRGGSRGELEAMRKNGSSFVAQIASSLVTDEAGKPVCTLGSYIDVTERRHAEESLRKERDRAQSYLNVAEVMMVVVDADEKVSLINKKGCEVLGCKTKEVIGKNWFDSFIPERSRERIRGLFKKVISGEVGPTEYFEGRVVTASGEERVVAWHSSVIVSEDGKIAGTLGSGVDITERKRAEEERGNLMQQLNQRVKELDCLYGISNVLAKQNISTEEIFNGIIVLIPQAWRYPEIACARICLGDQEFSTKNFRETEWKLSQDIVAHGERAGCVEVYYLEGRPEVAEGPFSKEERHLIDAVARRLSEAIERKEAKQTLRESEEKLRLMFETVSDGIIVSDVEGRITEANNSAVRMHGFARKEELIGKHGFDFIAEKDRARAREDLKKVLESGQPLDTATYTFVDSAGKEFKMEYRTSILYNGSGRMLGFLCAMRDITGRRRG